MQCIRFFYLRKHQDLSQKQHPPLNTSLLTYLRLAFQTHSGCAIGIEVTLDHTLRKTSSIWSSEKGTPQEVAKTRRNSLYIKNRGIVSYDTIF
jgi:hypothetical protein